MRGGGDSGGVGAGAAISVALSPSDGMLDRTANEAASGGTTLTVAGAGAQEEQQIVLSEHGFCGPSQPSWPLQSPS